jgi:hypothetical protein
MPYYLRNISKYDIYLEDLRYTILKGQVCDLLHKTSGLKLAAVEKSIISGSISKRLNKDLIEIKKDVRAKVNRINISKPQLRNDRLNKSSIKVEDVDIEEKLKEIMVSDDEEFLKELELNNGGLQEVPLVAKDIKAED